MKPLIICLLASVCLQAPCYGQAQKDNTPGGVNYQAGHFVTIVLREKLIGNQLLSISSQEEKLVDALKEEDFDPTDLKSLHTRETLLVISEKVSITLTEKFLQLQVANAEELGKLCTVLSKLDVHEIFISRNKREVNVPDSSTSHQNPLTNPAPGMNMTSNIVQPTGSQNKEIARIIGRLLDISVLVLTQRR